MKIDSHHHFWNYSAAEYDWISDDMSRIRRDYLPPDLAQAIDAAGVDGVVSVQARQIEEENPFLLDFAEKNDFIRGVVGWVPLVDPAIEDSLDRIAKSKWLKGVRHVLQGEADERYMLRPDFNRGVAALTGRGLAYDILVLEKQLPQTLQFVDRHPSQVFVVDHIGKPRIAAGELSPWQSRMVELAHRPNIYCKLSGMPSEADRQTWTPDKLRPYFDTVLSAFGPKRLMFGSDWPVCLVAVEYERWHSIVEEWVAELSADEQARILGDTAVEAYRL